MNTANPHLPMLFEETFVFLISVLACYSFRPIKTNLIPDMTHPNTINLDICITRFVVLEYVASDSRFVLFFQKKKTNIELDVTRI